MFIGCGENNNETPTDFSGTYCMCAEGIQITIDQTDEEATFTMQYEVSASGTGTVSGKNLTLSTDLSDSEKLTCNFNLSDDGQSLTGTFNVKDIGGDLLTEGTLNGTRGECPVYNISANGIPEFISNDFTELSKIEKISKFRSSYGHSYTDKYESCRSMKHYYQPFPNYMVNNNIEMYSPVNGTIISVTDEQHGSSTGLINKQIHIQPESYPAFTIILFHTDLISNDIKPGMTVQSGDLLGYARMYYDDLSEYANSFDIAVRVLTNGGIMLVSYFYTMESALFDSYISRGASTKQDFIITRQERDNNPLECDGDTFLTDGSLENWVTLN